MLQGTHQYLINIRFVFDQNHQKSIICLLLNLSLKHKSLIKINYSESVQKMSRMTFSVLCNQEQNSATVNESKNIKIKLKSLMIFIQCTLILEFMLWNCIEICIKLYMQNSQQRKSNSSKIALNLQLVKKLFFNHCVK